MYQANHDLGRYLNLTRCRSGRAWRRLLGLVDELRQIYCPANHHESMNAVVMRVCHCTLPDNPTVAIILMFGANSTLDVSITTALQSKT